ncbi:hypothetical protein JXB41_08735 [Candidatus Woesearchaeota archaeon]|nr:hypothetical protein [Candidatus Woesearchaeota archaeon]
MVFDNKGNFRGGGCGFYTLLGVSVAGLVLAGAVLCNGVFPKTVDEDGCIHKEVPYVQEHAVVDPVTGETVCMPSAGTMYFIGSLDTMLIYVEDNQRILAENGFLNNLMQQDLEEMIQRNTLLYDKPDEHAYEKAQILARVEAQKILYNDVIGELQDTYGVKVQEVSVQDFTESVGLPIRQGAFLDINPYTNEPTLTIIGSLPPGKKAALALENFGYISWASEVNGGAPPSTVNDWLVMGITGKQYALSYPEILPSDIAAENTLWIMAAESELTGGSEARTLMNKYYGLPPEFSVPGEENLPIYFLDTQLVHLHDLDIPVENSYLFTNYNGFEDRTGAPDSVLYSESIIDENGTTHAFLEYFNEDGYKIRTEEYDKGSFQLVNLQVITRDTAGKKLHHSFYSLPRDATGSVQRFGLQLHSDSKLLIGEEGNVEGYELAVLRDDYWRALFSGGHEWDILVHVNTGADLAPRDGFLMTYDGTTGTYDQKVLLYTPDQVINTLEGFHFNDPRDFLFPEWIIK